MVTQKVIDFLSDYYDIEKENISEQSNLMVDLGLTSYDVVEMLCQIEEEFNVIINTEEVTGIETVHDLVEKIQIEMK